MPDSEKDEILFPEMSAKILDESHFKFHVTCKAKMINAINKLKTGAHLLDTLSKLKFSTDKQWLKNSCDDPNVKIFLEILEEYKTHEHRPTRAKILIPLIEYAISLFASDLFFRERGEWFLYRLVQRSGEMKFHEVFVVPENWYPRRTHSYIVFAGGNTDWEKIENDPNKAPIEQEYKQWYGIDPLDDLIDIPVELQKKIIEENRAWMKKYNPMGFDSFGETFKPIADLIRRERK